MLSPARTLEWKNNGNSIIGKWVNFHRVLRYFIVISCDCACTGWPSLTNTNTTIFAPILLTSCGQSINNHHPLLWREIVTISFLLLLRSNLPRGCFPSLTEEPVIIHWLGDSGWGLPVWEVWLGELSFWLDQRYVYCCCFSLIVTWSMRPLDTHPVKWSICMCHSCSTPLLCTIIWSLWLRRFPLYVI